MKIEVEVDLEAEVAARIESLEKALTLTTNSREWNRKRVLELEDKLERIDRGHVCTGSCKPNAHVAFAGRQRIEELEKALAESRELVAFKNRVTEDKADDIEKLWANLKAERTRVKSLEDQLSKHRQGASAKDRAIRELQGLVKEERIGSNNLAQRLAQVNALAAQNLETRNSDLVASINLTEQTVAASLAEKRQTIEALESLLTAATTRSRKAREFLSERRVEEAVDTIITSKGAILADAIRNALAALSA